DDGPSAQELPEGRGSREGAEHTDFSPKGNPKGDPRDKPGRTFPQPILCLKSRFREETTMRSFVMGPVLVLVLAVAPLADAAQPPAPAPQATPEVTIVGPTGQTLRLDAGDLEDFPRAIVRMDAHGQHHVFEGAQLQAVLARAGAPSGEALRG